MFKFFNQHLRTQKSKFVLFITLSYILSGITLFMPILTGRIIDTITTKRNFEYLLFLTGIFAAFQICIIIMNYITYKLSIFIQTKLTFLINSNVIRHFQNILLSKTRQLDTVYVNQRINHDSNTVTSFILDAYTNTGIQAVTTIISIVYLLRIDYRIAILLVAIVIVYLTLYCVFKRKLYEMSLLYKESQSNFFGVLNEQLENVYFLQIHSIKKLFFQKLLKHFEVFLGKVMKSQRFFFFYQSLDSIITMVTQIVIYLIGGMSVIRGEITIGEFTILASYFQYIMTGVTYFSNLAQNYQEALTSYDRLNEYLQMPLLENGKRHIKKIQNIVIRNVSFARGKQRILNSINYEFVQGYIYGIIGKNGSGKSTLINLLLGLNTGEYSGEIYYNDININHIDMNWTRAHNISVIEQNPYIFEGSVLDNVLLSSDYKEKYCKFFYKTINLSHFSLNKKIFKDGNTLSGGEKQKIALLRLFAKNAELMILDEPTNFLDSSTVDSLKKFLTSIKRNKIVIIVSHDKEIEDICDYTFKLE